MLTSLILSFILGILIFLFIFHVFLACVNLTTCKNHLKYGSSIHGKILAILKIYLKNLGIHFHKDSLKIYRCIFFHKKINCGELII